MVELRSEEVIVVVNVIVCFCLFLQRVPIFAYFSLVAYAKYKSNERSVQATSLTFLSAVIMLWSMFLFLSNTEVFFPFVTRLYFFLKYRKRYKYESTTTSLIRRENENYVERFSVKCVAMQNYISNISQCQRQTKLPS